MSVQTCTICLMPTGQLKRHLVDAHGWRYTAESPDDPQPIKEAPLSQKTSSGAAGHSLAQSDPTPNKL
jgi:hypothetical protein